MIDRQSHCLPEYEVYRNQLSDTATVTLTD